MSYKIVEFENAEVVVILESWLTPNRKQAYWPPPTDCLSYTRMLRKCQDADDTWETYPIARIFYETDTAEEDT
ncbi:hypothetical protein NQ315_014887 [Exocentrus adspersus]|uniref:Uncharacterized protein n=1 Tax=Exocentrus adspersus TaxID=1586481 RepID=A0AAV8VL83_9CUCU|nr:hypothetical protein NQ315_014887 [Exocentrus adspersus]